MFANKNTALKLLFMSIILICSCRKTKLTNHLCDCANTKVIETIDTVTLKIPNIFTPNADGVNDYWFITNLEYFQNVKLKIKDNGVLKKTVFESNNYNNTWDGTNDGKALSDGKYAYELIIDSKTISGYVCIFGLGKIEPKDNKCLQNCTPADPRDIFLMN